MKFRLICATRYSSDDFFKKSALGRSYLVYKSIVSGFELICYYNNREGLPVIYNQEIDKSVNDPAILVFVHDDVHLCDLTWFYSLTAGLTLFDVVGVAGNKRRIPKQASWVVLDDQFTPESVENLVGCYGSGTGFPPNVINIWPNSVGQECKLLDGVLLAVKSTTLIDNNIRFDPKFKFHFYDMDFCRQVELKGLKMGTCSFLIHESDGEFDQSWHDAYQLYLKKYGE